MGIALTIASGNTGGRIEKLDYIKNASNRLLAISMSFWNCLEHIQSFVILISEQFYK